MPENPEQQSEKPTRPVDGKVDIPVGAEVRVRLFQEAVRAVHVSPIEKGWQVFRIGTEPIQFPEKSLAIEIAKENAKKNNLDVLVHDKSGHAIKLSD